MKDFKSNAHNVAFIGIMGALEFVVLFLETYVFQVLIPIAPPCFLSISIAITISLFADYKNMFIGGTIFGFCSFFIAIIIGNAVFILPWNSILPRFFIGITAYLSMIGVRAITKNSTNKFLKNYLPYSVGAIVGTLTNTILVLTILYIGKFVGTEEIIATFISINFPFEVVLSAILVPIFVNVVKKVRRSK